MGDLSPAILLDAVRKQIDTKWAEESLYQFVRQAWSTMEPGIEFVPSWHIEVICEHLQAVTEGRIKRLLINIPPRHSKSTIVSVAFPCWEWIRRPQEKYLCASYSGTLAMRDNLKARRLVTSPWYQERWGHVFQLSGDQNQKTRFENDKTGYRIATSVGGTATGEGGSRLILDDAISTTSAQSDAIRESTIEWLNMAWSTRLNNAKTDAMIEVAQRSHEMDPSGLRLAQGGWEHVCIPAEYEGQQRKTSLYVNGYDPRKEIGELICPDRFGRREIDDLKRQLGEMGAAGQLQQRPSPAGGGILKVNHFQLWKDDLPALDFVVQSYDTAFSEEEQNDPTACTSWGFFEHEGRRCAILLDAWAEHLSYPDLREKVLDDWQARYGSDAKKGRRGRKADLILVEKKASGQSLLQDLALTATRYEPWQPGSKDKRQRAHLTAPVLETDCVYILESKKVPGKPISWAQDFINQCEKFPNAEHDDLVDTFTQVVLWGKLNKWLLLESAPRDEVEEQDYHRKKRVNPYGV